MKPKKNTPMPPEAQALFEKVEDDLLRGIPQVKLAKKYGVSRHQVYRFARHLRHLGRLG